MNYGISTVSLRAGRSTSRIPSAVEHPRRAASPRARTEETVCHVASGLSIKCKSGLLAISFIKITSGIINKNVRAVVLEDPRKKKKDRKVCKVFNKIFSGPP